MQCMLVFIQLIGTSLKVSPFNKIVSLVDVIKNLKVVNEQLQIKLAERDKEIVGLKKQIEMLESSMLDETGRLQKLHEEKELTKTVVDDLIKHIDALVESGSQSS